MLNEGVQSSANDLEIAQSDIHEGESWNLGDAYRDAEAGMSEIPLEVVVSDDEEAARISGLSLDEVRRRLNPALE